MTFLMKDRRFLPLLITAVLGALNDNMIKAAIIVFAAMSVPADEAATIGLLAGGLLMLPFVLFSGLAGTISDKFEKSQIIKATKLSELGLAVIATGVLYMESLTGMLAMVFLMGTQSSLFGPLKLGWLPERLKRDELMRANAWLETGTFVAILLGTVAGGLLVGAGSLVFVGIAAVILAIGGLIASIALPRGTPAAPDLKVRLNPLSGNVSILKELFSDAVMARSTILIAWFWAAGSVCLSSLPAYLRTTFDADATAVTLTMALFALGIGAGSFYANRSLKGEIGLSTILPAVTIITAASFFLSFGISTMPAGGGLASLVATPKGMCVLTSLFAIAFGGGMFAVPLKALIQSRAPADARARTIAALNITTSLAIAGTSALIALAVASGLAVGMIFLGMAVSAAAALIATIIFFPRAALQGLLRGFLLRWFRVEIEGREHLSTKGPVVFTANHVSLLDGPLLFSLIERECSIAMNTGWAGKPFLKHLARIVPVAPIDPQRPMAAKSLAANVRDGSPCLIFPEGRISTHTALMKVYPGTAWLVDASSAPVVNITISGLEFSLAARPKSGLRRKLFPKVRIRVEAPQHLDIDPEIRGRARRIAATRALQDILEEGRRHMLDSASATLPEAFARAAEQFGVKQVAISDPLGTTLNRKKIALGGAVFSRLLQERTQPGEVVGVLLPGVASVPVVLMGLWRSGRVPAMLNPTLGRAPACSALRTAQISRVLSSRDFVAKAGIEDMIEAFEEKGIEILWTEDLKAAVTAKDKISALIASRRDMDVPIDKDHPAAVLFTSGTEGAPKGVVLSHANLLANVAQLRARTDVSFSDRVLCALPMFHSFGLTGGLLLPLLSGASVAIYPSPLHYRVIPELAYAEQSTLIFGTDTFLAGWGRRASSYDFSSLRAAIAGAEPVKEATRKMWSERFGVRILEGYGATEAGPVVGLNTPIEQMSGTVGRLLPGIEHRFEAVPGIDGDRLWIKGPNIMSGYYLPDEPGVLHPPVDGWYDTGDVVKVDDAGFVSICGRVKRFAKVGGEMVSLGAIEALASDIWQDATVAAISIPCPRKGERVLLVTESAAHSRQELAAAAKARGMAEILLPSEVVLVAKIPMLASGKTNYPMLSQEVIGQREIAA